MPGFLLRNRLSFRGFHFSANLMHSLVRHGKAPPKRVAGGRTGLPGGRSAASETRAGRPGKTGGWPGVPPFRLGRASMGLCANQACFRLRLSMMRRVARFWQWVLVAGIRFRVTGSLPLPSFLRVVTGPRVPASVYRFRLRQCQRCPLYERRFRMCGSVAQQRDGLGCGCWLPAKAMFTVARCWSAEVGARDRWHAD